jgi:signal peptidase I
VIRPPAAPLPEPAPLVPGFPTDLRRWGVEVVQILLLAGAIYLAMTAFLAEPFVVEMRSMEPTIASNDRVLIDKLTPRWDAYGHGEVVVFDAPPPFDRDAVPYIKRVIALPGERVQLENGRVYVTDVEGLTRRLDEPYLAADVRTLPQGRSGAIEWTVGEGEIFVLGDNRSASVDSRTFGPVETTRILGRAWFRYLPLERIGIIADG